MAYSCTTCGVIADLPASLCSPSEGAACGSAEKSSGSVCAEKQVEMKYVCGGCGRRTDAEYNVCKPQPIGE